MPPTLCFQTSVTHGVIPILAEVSARQSNQTFRFYSFSGTLDGRTPVGSAEEVRKGFRNSKHLIIEGAWHSDPLFLSSLKIKDVMLEFMCGTLLSTIKITLPPL